MSQGPHAWILGRLDAFLTEEQRRSPPEELGRYRVLVGALLFLLTTAMLVVGTGPLLLDPLPRMMAGTASVGWVSLLLLLRRQSSPRIPALVVCGLLTATLMVATFAMSQPGRAQSLPSEVATAAFTLIPVLAVYLAGVRAGFFFTAFFCINVGVLRPLYLSDFGALHPVFSEVRPWVNGFLEALLLMLTWSLSALFSSARDAANATVRESERKLVSLIESTDDPVCALDAEGRIVSANSAAKQIFHEAFGREARPGDTLDERTTAEKRTAWRARLARVLQGQPHRYEVSYTLGDRTLELDLSLHPILDAKGRPVGVTVFGRDITERKRAEARQNELHRSLMEASRQAGMAEVATGALHNVGNTLNSVNVSASVVLERLRGSRMPLLARAVDLLKEHAQDLPTFLSEDARGQKLPEYLSFVTHQLGQEHGMMVEEMQRLVRNMEHVKAVVSVQQEHARLRGQVEPIQMAELIDDALRLHAASFERSGIRMRRECAELPPVLVDRHRLLQILVNLLSNARHALLESEREEKLLSLRVRAGEEGRLRIEVCDNGVGVAPEHMPRLFAHGFTTKKDGHGFGLHASAAAAEEMGGRLSCESGGRGSGRHLHPRAAPAAPGSQGERMNRRLVPRVRAALLAASMAGTLAHSHQTPPGDVYPVVTRSERGFVVTYRSSLEDRYYAQPHGLDGQPSAAKKSVPKSKVPSSVRTVNKWRKPKNFPADKEKAVLQAIFVGYGTVAGTMSDGTSAEWIPHGERRCLAVPPADRHPRAALYPARKGARWPDGTRAARRTAGARLRARRLLGQRGPPAHVQLLGALFRCARADPARGRRIHVEHGPCLRGERGRGPGGRPPSRLEGAVPHPHVDHSLARGPRDSGQVASTALTRPASPAAVRQGRLGEAQHPLALGLRQPEALDLRRQVLPLQLAADAGVEPHRERGVLELALAAAAELAHQVRVPAQVILLVVVLGPVERGQRQDGQQQGTALPRHGLPRRRERLLLLRLVRVEHGRHVLALVGTLGGVGLLPEPPQQRLVGDPRRVVVELEGLRVVPEPLIGRVRLAAAGVAHTGPNHSRQTPEPGVGAPESTQGEGGRLHAAGGRFELQGWLHGVSSTFSYG